MKRTENKAAGLLRSVIKACAGAKGAGQEKAALGRGGGSHHREPGPGAEGPVGLMSAVAGRERQTAGRAKTTLHGGARGDRVSQGRKSRGSGPGRVHTGSPS